MKKKRIDKIIAKFQGLDPEQLLNNTETVIAFYNKEFDRAGLPPLSYEQQEIIRSWKPETITRARRHYKKGTEAQYVEEVHTRDIFTNKQTNPPLYENY
tara:strand:+ start:445 stop:741 length:297 start_codon:yes stop_codon:yes gene_type:complete